MMLSTFAPAAARPRFTNSSIFSFDSLPVLSSPGTIAPSLATSHRLIRRHQNCRHRIQHRSNRGEMFAAGLVEILADLGQLLDDGLVLRHLAVEHAQRIGLGPSLAVGRSEEHT